MSKPDFTKSTQTVAITERLRAASIGEVVSYDALSDALGEEVTKARHHLYAALKALHDDGLAFGTVRGEGVKRLSADELPAIGDAALLHIRRTSRRTRRKLNVANKMNDVSNETMVRISTSVSQLGAIELFANSKTAATIAPKVSNGALPPKKLLEALK